MININKLKERQAKAEAKLNAAAVAYDTAAEEIRTEMGSLIETTRKSAGFGRTAAARTLRCSPLSLYQVERPGKVKVPVTFERQERHFNALQNLIAKRDELMSSVVLEKTTRGRKPNRR